MNYDVYLICLTRGEPRLVEKIKELWPESVHITTEEFGVAESGTVELLFVAVERKNGVTLLKDVYDKIEAECGAFQSLIVPIGSDGYYGFWRRTLWEWLGKVTG